MVHVDDFRAYCIKTLEINGAIVCHEQKRYNVRMCTWGGKRNYSIESELINTDDKYLILTEEEFNEHFRQLPKKLKERTLKHGHWTWDDNNECWVCDNCKSSALNDYRGNSTDSHYCPHCGKEMYQKGDQSDDV
jgi:hypothetical protein